MTRGPLRIGVMPGQRYHDEPVHVVLTHLKTDPVFSAALSMFKGRAPGMPPPVLEELTHHVREQLDWVVSDQKGGVRPARRKVK